MSTNQESQSALLYCRTATKNYPRIFKQARILKEYAKDHNIDVVRVYTDNGYSGLSLDRPGLNQLRKEATKRKAGILLTLNPDRLARNVGQSVQMIHQLEDKGIKVIFAEILKDSHAFKFLQSLIDGPEQQNMQSRIQKRVTNSLEWKKKLR